MSAFPASQAYGGSPALLHAHMIRIGDRAPSRPYWNELRWRHERALAALLGYEVVSVPRVRVSSIKLKQRGEQPAAGGREMHGTAPVVWFYDKSALSADAKREMPSAFPRNDSTGGAS